MEQSGIERNLILEFVIEHIICGLDISDKLILINYLYYNTTLSTFESNIKKYFDKFILQEKGITGLLLSDSQAKMYIKGANNWVVAEPQDIQDLGPATQRILIINPNDYAKFVGFFTSFKDNYMVFKVKNMDDKRAKGADVMRLLKLRCFHY